MFFSVKNSREQATSQRLHFVISREGFGKGMNTFLPDSSNSLSDFGHLSAYLESVLHSPQQQCLVPTMPLPFFGLSLKVGRGRGTRGRGDARTSKLVDARGFEDMKNK